MTGKKKKQRVSPVLQKPLLVGTAVCVPNPVMIETKRRTERRFPCMHNNMATFCPNPGILLHYSNNSFASSPNAQKSAIQLKPISVESVKRKGRLRFWWSEYKNHVVNRRLNRKKLGVRVQSIEYLSTSNKNAEPIVQLPKAIAAPPAPTIKKESYTQTIPKPSRKASKEKMYRLFIINDPFNTREFVVKILLEIVGGLTFSKAYSAMQEAHTNGKGLVVVTSESLAEEYCTCINAKGVFSTIEPDE